MVVPAIGIARVCRALVLYSGLLVPTMPVVGQAATPSDIDLRSAYCLPIVKNAAIKSREMASQMSVAVPANELDARVTASVAKTARERQDELARLQAYLIPKLTLDSTALVLAMDRGQTDLGQIDGVATACAKQCPGSEPPTDRAELDRRLSCINTCFESYPASQRVRTCFPVNWLPF